MNDFLVVALTVAAEKALIFKYSTYSSTICPCTLDLKRHLETYYCFQMLTVIPRYIVVVQLQQALCITHGSYVCFKRKLAGNCVARY